MQFRFVEVYVVFQQRVGSFTSIYWYGRVDKMV